MTEHREGFCPNCGRPMEFEVLSIHECTDGIRREHLDGICPVCSAVTATVWEVSQ